MIAEARAQGLLVDQDRVNWVLGAAERSPYIPPGVGLPVHESLTCGWQMTEIVPKPYYDRTTGRETHRMNLGRRRSIPDGSLIHDSAYLRGCKYCERRLPPGAVQVPRIPVTT